MNTRIATVAIGLLAAGSLTLNAQAPQATPTPQAETPKPAITQAPAQTPPQAPARAAAANQAITISGCLQEEKNVPGLKPNVAERAGVTNDFVVTNVKISPSSSVSGIGVASKYEVEGIAEAELKKHLNHQVELVGTIVQAESASKDDAPDFRATSMKMLAATCTAE